MSKWIFVDLHSFVDKIASFLEGYSIYYLSLNIEEFEQRDQGIYPRILFFNGHGGVKSLVDQLKYSKEKDVICLVMDSSQFSSEQRQEIDSFLIKSRQIKGIIDLACGMGFVISSINGVKQISDFLFEEEVGREYVEHFEQRLAKVKEGMSFQLKHIRHLHRSLIPLKEYQLDLLKTVFHYRVGESHHSEFWDISQTENQQLVFLLGTKSSQALSKVLNSSIEFLQKESFRGQDIQDFYQYLQQTIKEEFSVLMMLSEKEKAESLLITNGGILFFLNGVELSSLKGGELSCLNLNNRDRLFVISSGMVKNYEKNFRKDELMRMLKKEWTMPSDHFIHQLFFRAKFNRPGRFYDHDGVAVVFEVAS